MAWTTIPATDSDSESPLTETLLTALANNPEAIAKRLSGAPTVVKVDSIQEQAGSAEMRMVVLNIGTWDMDADGTKAVAHSLTGANIRAATAAIRNDNETDVFMIEGSSTSANGGSIGWDGTNINLGRASAPGIFDNANYNSISGNNRGWVTIWYVKP